MLKAATVRAINATALTKHVVTGVFLFGLLTAPTTGNASDETDWPCFRGPSHDAISAHASPPIKWSGEEGIVWKTPLVGVGHSSPIVIGQQVIITAFDPETEARLALSYDRETGAERWRTELVRAAAEVMHPKNTPASSTPASDGRLVVVTFAIDNAYYVAALGTGGELQWQRTLGPFVSRHGFHSCPVIHAGAVYLAGLQDDPASFVAKLDLETGETLWLSETGTEIRSFSPPHLTEIGGTPAVVVSGASRTFALDADTGDLIWQVPGPAEKTVAAICQVGDRIFVAGGRDSQLYAIGTDSIACELTWKTSSGVPYVPSPVAYDGAIHLLSDEGVYTRVDVDSGKKLGKKRLCRAVSASPFIAGNRLYVTDEEGMTTVAELGDKLKVLSKNDLGESVFASPVPSGNAIFIRGVEHLYRIGG